MQTLDGRKTRTDVGLADEATETVAAGLNQYLSELHVLYAKLHNFHWNIEGESFYTLHEELQSLYEAIAEEIDDVAERVLKIGHRPLARLADYVAAAQLEEAESRRYTGQEIGAAIIEDYRYIMSVLRDLITRAQEHGDEGTADEAIGWLKDKEKVTWMLTAYVS
ncbi:MAG: Dps family protein [Spirochaetaceae bacterium]